MPEEFGGISNLSDLKMFAEMIANIVVSKVIAQLNGVYYKIFVGIILSMTSAISYLYITHKSERKAAAKERQKTNDRLYAVLEESTRLMEIVKNGLKESSICEKETKKSIERMSKIIQSFIKHNKVKGNYGIDNIMESKKEDLENSNENEKEEERNNEQ